MGYKAFTKNGYALSDLASAVQKAARRGDEQRLLFWAREMEISNYGNYLWKRLRIIAAEDIGFASPIMIAQIDALHDVWRIAGECRYYPIVQACMMIARTQKLRLSCDAGVFFLETPRHVIDAARQENDLTPSQIDVDLNRLVIDEGHRWLPYDEVYASTGMRSSKIDAMDRESLYEMLRDGNEWDALHHVTQFDLKRRDVRDWLWQSIRVFGCALCGVAAPQLPVLLKGLHETYTDLTTKYAGGDSMLMVVQAIQLLARCKHDADVHHASVLLFETDELSEFPSIPDFVYDQHTARGKQLGRKVAHFIDEACVLENEFAPRENRYFELWTEYWIQKEGGRQVVEQPELAL